MAALGNRETQGRLAGDFVNGFGQREPIPLAAHLAQQQWKCPVEARVRAARYVEAVAGDARERMGERLAVRSRNFRLPRP